MHLAQGTIIDDRYEILSLLGRGGFASVFKAQQIGLEREVAIKLINTQMVDQQAQLKRFEREAQILSTLHHRNLPIFYGYGRWQGMPYLASELVNGVSLDDWFQDNPGPMRLSMVMAITKQVCSALSCAHTNDIVHRDISASNIMLVAGSESTELNEEATVKVIDFGLAKLMVGGTVQKLTDAGCTIGSVLYMSPEQCLTSDLDPRSDIYSAGCVLHLCLTGSPPFSGENIISLMEKQLKSPLPRILGKTLDATDDQERVLQEILDRATAKDAADRFQTIDELNAALAAVEGHKNGGKTLNASPAKLSNLSSSKRQALAALAAVIVAGLLAFLGYASSTRDDSAPAKAIPADESTEPLNVDTANKQVRKLLDGRKTLEALLISNRVVNERPSADSYAMRGQCYLNLHDRRAVDDSLKAATLKPTEPIRYQLLQAYRAFGMNAEALALCNKVVAEDKQQGRYYSRWNLYRADVNEALQRYDIALAEVEFVAKALSEYEKTKPVSEDAKIESLARLTRYSIGHGKFQQAAQASSQLALLLAKKEDYKDPEGQINNVRELCTQWIAAGDCSAALTLAQGIYALSKKPNFQQVGAIEAKLILADALANNGKLEQARRMTESALAETKTLNDPLLQEKALFTKAVICSKSGDRRNEELYRRQNLQLFQGKETIFTQDYRDAALRLAFFYLDVGDYDKAVSTMKELTDFDRVHPKLVSPLSLAQDLITWGSINSAFLQRPEAINHFEEGIGILSSNGQYKSELAVALLRYGDYWRTGWNFDRSMPLYSKVISLDEVGPTSMLARYGLASQFYWRQQYQQAESVLAPIKTWEKRLAKNDDRRIDLLRLVQAYNDAGLADAAKDSANLFLNSQCLSARHPCNRGSFYMSLGQAYVRSGRYRDATSMYKHCYEDCFKLTPNAISTQQALLRWSEAEQMTGNTNQAIALLNKAATVKSPDPVKSHYLAWRLFASQAWNALARGEREKAVQFMQKAQEQYFQEPRSQNLVAEFGAMDELTRLYILAGRADLAQPLIESSQAKAIRFTHHKNMLFVHRTALALWLAGKFEESEKVAEEALKLLPTDHRPNEEPAICATDQYSFTLMLLADTNARRGRLDRANTLCMQALQHMNPRIVHDRTIEMIYQDYLKQARKSGSSTELKQIEEQFAGKKFFQPGLFQ